MVVTLASSGAWGLDCAKPPTSGFGGADYRAYADWCTACGGTPSSANGVSCTPGPNWGRSSDTTPPAPSGDFILDVFSGGAYSTERKLAAAKDLNRLALERWVQQERERRREIFDRVAGELKLGDEALPAYSPRAATQPQVAATGRVATRQACVASPGGSIRPSSNQVVCNTLSCGATENAPTCCPPAFPLLNPCDCKCYADAGDIECSSYMACQYFKPK